MLCLFTGNVERQDLRKSGGVCHQGSQTSDPFAKVCMVVTLRVGISILDRGHCNILQPLSTLYPTHQLCLIEVAPLANTSSRRLDYMVSLRQSGFKHVGHVWQHC